MPVSHLWRDASLAERILERLLAGVKVRSNIVLRQIERVGVSSHESDGSLVTIDLDVRAEEAVLSSDSSVTGILVGVDPLEAC